MAYSNTQVNYYDDTNIIKSSYAANISGLLSRIEDAHTAIKKKAIELGLKIPAGKRLTTNASGTSDLALADSHNILDTAAAINNIPINTDTAKTLNAGGSYTVPVGFNAVAYKVTAKTLSSLIICDPAAGTADVLEGKKFFTNGTVQTGTMADKSDNLTLADDSSYGPYTYNSTDYLYFKIPATGKYTKDSQLQSTIPYYSSGSVEIPVTITVGSTGETIASTSQFFPQGYYSGGVKIKAVYDGTTTNKVINIDNAVGQLNAQSGKLSITSGYDYFAADASYSVKTGSVSAVTRSVNSSTGVVSFSGGTTTAGWISDNVTLPATYTPTDAIFSADAVTGKVTVSTAGWVTKGSEIGGLLAGSATMSGPTQNTGSSAITVGSTSVSAGNYYMKLVKTAGYITAATSAIVLGATSLSAAALSSAGSNATTITSKYFKVTASAGYNASVLTKNLTVLDAKYPINTSNGKMIVTQAGWIPLNTVLATAQTYEMDEDDIINTTFVVACATNTPMTQLTVDTNVILNRLTKI